MLLIVSMPTSFKHQKIRFDYDIAEHDAISMNPPLIKKGRRV